MNIIINKLKDLKLEINNKTRIYSNKEGFEFLGYKFKINSNNKLLVLVKYKNRVNIRRKVRKKGNIILNRYKGYLSVSNVKLINKKKH